MKTEIKTVRKIVLKTGHKIIYSYFKKKMSFIKVKDPRKREELIRDFIETRKRIKDNFIAKKVGEIEYQTGLTKLFKPVTETQKATAKEITEAQKAATEKITQELLPIKEGIENLPGAISFPALEMAEEEEEKKDVGKLALNYLAFATGKNSDKTFGIKPDEEDENKLKIGSKEIEIIGNNIKIEDKIYTGTPGLWELIVRKELPKAEYTEEDYLNYGRILKQTNTIYHNSNPMSNKPKSSKGDKWKKLIKPIWDDIKKEGKGGKGKGKGKGDPKPGTSGTGLNEVGQGLKILPSDPNALIDRFDLLFSSQKAGHTGVRNEIVSILDELKRQGVLKTNEYKKLNSLIKK